MNLFNRKTLKRHIKADPIPSDHLTAPEAWAELISSRRIEGLKETALHGQFASNIVEGVLGYHGPAGGADYNVSAEHNILRGSVDLALGRFGGKTPDIVAPFELKGADTRDLDAIIPGRNKSPVQQAWEYAMNARGVKWVLVSNMIELRLYGFGEGTSAYEVFRLDQLTDPEEYARFMLLLSAESLLSGRTADLLKESRREDKDITYLPMRRGFLYLVAIMDWHTRKVLAWRISNTLEAGFCVDALNEAIHKFGPPDILNTDQGSQFTSFAWTNRLRSANMRISMDGKGRFLDNIFVERLWRSLKYECVYLHAWETGSEARDGVRKWIEFYNHKRPHSALGSKPPAVVYWQRIETTSPDQQVQRVA